MISNINYIKNQEFVNGLNEIIYKNYYMSFNRFDIDFNLLNTIIDNTVNENIKYSNKTVQEFNIIDVYNNLKNFYIENIFKVRNNIGKNYIYWYYYQMNTLLENKYKVSCFDIEKILTILDKSIKNGVIKQDLTTKDLLKLNLKHLFYKNKFELQYIKKFDIEFVIIQILGHDSNNITVFFKNKSEQKVFNFKKNGLKYSNLKKICKPLKKLTRQQYNDLNNVKSYKELYLSELKGKNVIWKLRKENKLKQEKIKEQIKSNNKKYVLKNNFRTINNIIDCLNSYYTFDEIIDICNINIFNIDEIILHFKQLENTLYNKLDLLLDIDFKILEYNIFVQYAGQQFINNILTNNDLKEKDLINKLDIIMPFNEYLKENKTVIIEQQEKQQDIKNIENDYFN